jgi:hypothetical protein
MSGPVTCFRKIFVLVLVVMASFGLSGCGDGRYELKEDGTGRLVRLDRWLGGVAVLEGNTLVELLDPGTLASLAGIQRNGYGNVLAVRFDVSVGPPIRSSPRVWRASVELHGGASAETLARGIIAKLTEDGLL